MPTGSEATYLFISTCNLGEPSYLQQPASPSSHLSLWLSALPSQATQTDLNRFHPVTQLQPFSSSSYPFFQVILLVLVVLTCSILKVFTVESIESTSASNAYFLPSELAASTFVSYYIISSCYSLLSRFISSCAQLPTSPNISQHCHPSTSSSSSSLVSSSNHLAKPQETWEHLELETSETSLSKTSPKQ